MDPLCLTPVMAVSPRNACGADSQLKCTPSSSAFATSRLRARHVAPVATVQAGDRFRALTDRGANAIHRRVAATDDHNILPSALRCRSSKSGTASFKALPV
jgi:hypothetical protein